MTKDDQFRHMVLNALWVLILCAFGKHQAAQKAAINFQSNAIRFGDEYGNKSEGAAEYRREVTYGGTLS